MNVRASAFWLGLLCLAAVVACTNGGGLSNVSGGGGTTPSPPPNTGIGVAIPSGKIGVEDDPAWGTIGGYTQNQTSQVIAYPPGTTLTITNLSSRDPHTLNVIAQTNGPPPQWPASPSLSFSPSGNGVLGGGYASGTLNPGASVKVKLSKPGIYLIGCAFHYSIPSEMMRGIIEVANGATPGPTASPGSGGYAKRRAARHAVSAQPHLIDQRGRTFTLASLRGRPVVLTFVSAHCTDACPLINAQFSDAARRLQAHRLRAKLLTVTLDPQNDSPRTMRTIATRFEANPQYWLLAGGSVPNVEAVMHEFGVVSKPGRDGYREEHTTFVYFLSPDGKLSQTMLASSNLSDSIVETISGHPEVSEQ